MVDKNAVKIIHRTHANIMTFINNKQIVIKDHEGYTDLETAEVLTNSPFGYEWGGPIEPFDPKTWTKKNKSIVWNEIMPYFEGYGYVAQMMIYGLKQIGVDVSVFYKDRYDYVKAEIMDCFFKPRRYDSWGMWHHYCPLPGKLPFEKKAMYTMWESTQLGKDWIQPLNDVNLVFVPCEHNRQTFIENGIKTPIRIIQHGVDQEYYFYREKPQTDTFIVGTVGSLVPRKNPELLIRAFLDELGECSDAKLVLKDTNWDTELERTYKHNTNIIFNGDKVSPMQMGDLLATFDLAVFPSRGEGFGLGGIQAMGVGTTCACTDWGGFKEYLNPEYNYAINYKLANIKAFPSNNTWYNGQWAEADYEHLRSILKYGYEHKDELREKGKKAAQWVKERWTWEKCAHQLVTAIDDYESNGR